MTAECGAVLGRMSVECGPAGSLVSSTVVTTAVPRESLSTTSDVGDAHQSSSADVVDASDEDVVETFLRHDRPFGENSQQTG